MASCTRMSVRMRIQAYGSMHTCVGYFSSFCVLGLFVCLFVCCRMSMCREWLSVVVFYECLCVNIYMFIYIYIVHVCSTLTCIHPTPLCLPMTTTSQHQHLCRLSLPYANRSAFMLPFTDPRYISNYLSPNLKFCCYFVFLSFLISIPTTAWLIGLHSLSMLFKIKVKTMFWKKNIRITHTVVIPSTILKLSRPPFSQNTLMCSARSHTYSLARSTTRLRVRSLRNRNTFHIQFACVIKLIVFCQPSSDRSTISSNMFPVLVDVDLNTFCIYRILPAAPLPPPTIT